MGTAYYMSDILYYQAVQTVATCGSSRTRTLEADALAHHSCRVPLVKICYRWGDMVR